MWYSSTEPGFESPYRYHPSLIARFARSYGWQASCPQRSRPVRRSCERSERLAKVDQDPHRQWIASSIAFLSGVITGITAVVVPPNNVCRPGMSQSTIRPKRPPPPKYMIASAPVRSSTTSGCPCDHAHSEVLPFRRRQPGTKRVKKVPTAIGTTATNHHRMISIGQRS